MHFEAYPFEKLARLLEGVVPDATYAGASLTIGEPQFSTPAIICDALSDHAGELRYYPKTAGEEYLRAAMREFVRRRFGTRLRPEQLVPTFGTREVLFNFPQYLLFAASDPVMVFPNPFYQIYEGAAIASRARAVYLRLDASHGFKPDIEAFRHELVHGLRPQLVILNSPNNPTASVMTREELAAWVTLALEYDFVVLNDECYSEIYTATPPASLLEASVAAGNPEFRNCLVLNSISKRSSAPGLRSGFIAGDAAILAGYMQYRTYAGCASPLPLQRAAAVAWSDEAHVEEAREQYRHNFAVAREVLGVPTSDATFYLWLNVGDDLAVTRELYRRANVKVLPGRYLGREGVGEGYIRLALVYDSVTTREVLSRIKEIV